MKKTLVLLFLYGIYHGSISLAPAQTLLGKASLVIDWGVNSKIPLPRKEVVKFLTLGGDGDWKILCNFDLPPDLVVKLTPGCVGQLAMDVGSLSLLMFAEDGDYSNVTLIAYPMLKSDWREWGQADWHVLAADVDYDKNAPLFEVPLNVPEIVKTKKLILTFPISNLDFFKQASLQGILIVMSGERGSTMVRQIDVAGSANSERSPLTLSFYDKLPPKP